MKSSFLRMMVDSVSMSEMVAEKTHERIWKRTTSSNGCCCCCCLLDWHSTRLMDSIYQAKRNAVQDFYVGIWGRKFHVPSCGTSIFIPSIYFLEWFKWNEPYYPPFRVVLSGRAHEIRRVCNLLTFLLSTRYFCVFVSCQRITWHRRLAKMFSRIFVFILKHRLDSYQFKSIWANMFKHILIMGVQ